MNGVVWGLLMGVATLFLYGSLPLAGVMAGGDAAQHGGCGDRGRVVPAGAGADGAGPVMGSSILLTGITDSMGFLIFLGLATAFLLKKTAPFLASGLSNFGLRRPTMGVTARGETSMSQLEPYLFFDGNCADAIRFYEKALGGKLEMMMKASEAPAGRLPERQSGRRHACLCPRWAIAA